MSLEVSSLHKATLRAHPSPVSCVQFHPTEPWLVSGDETGWLFWWSITQRRPIAIWKPHEKSIVALKWINDWDSSTGACQILLSHGRDNKIKIFRLDAEELYSTEIPLTSKQTETGRWKTPWLVHTQDVNAMNFCAVSVFGTSIAVPNTLDSEKIDIYNLRPEFSRPFFAIEGKPKSLPPPLTKQAPANPSDFSAFALDPPPSGSDSDTRSATGTGIVMALVLTDTHLMAGYESGHVILFDITTPGSPTQLYCDKTHQHPILSLAFNPSDNTFLSSSADSLLVKHDLASSQPLQIVNTKHVGLTSLALRSDGKIFATAGWDGMVRIYTYKTIKPLAAFKGSEGQLTDKTGITSVTFSPVFEEEQQQQTSLTLLSNLETARQRRARQTHWIAVGAKDGRIRLSSIY